MAVIRKRLIFWLIKAYIKKSGKTILFSFLFGLFIFFAMLFIGKYYTHIVPFTHTETIGLTGAYSQDALPSEITSKMSIGLTTIAKDGSIKPGLASSWDILDNGKVYRFHLKHGLHFSDGQKVTSSTVNYNFSDVNQSAPDAHTIVFTLKEAYAPFLVAVAKPVFDGGFNGVGDYHLENITTSDNFVQSLTLVSTKNGGNIIHYVFYPTETALKTAYLLGEVTEVKNVNTITSDSLNLKTFPNTTVTKQTDYAQLVTLFFNNEDGNLSNKKLRVALTYAIPNTFSEGARAYSPYSPLSLYYDNELNHRVQDLARAKLLLLPDATSSLSGKIKMPSQLTIKTFRRYKTVAQQIAAVWKKIGITTTIELVDSIPSNYQIFLGDFNIPSDPDQYTLWHSDAPDNITHYRNLRIDKLLEDGRKTIDINKRKQIYANFQRFLLEDAPAEFLYYPYQYTIVRK